MNGIESDDMEETRTHDNPNEAHHMYELVHVFNWTCR